jgi:FKBP-type peptidyl-prolyl cis-trans isomerase FklB
MTTSPLSSALRCTPAVLVAAATLILAGCGKDEKKTAAGDKPAAGVAGITTDEQKVSYGIGYNMGSGVADQKAFTVDQAALKAGLEDGLTKTKTRISEQDLEKAFQTVQQKAAAAAAVEGEKQGAAGVAFLAKNKTRAGVKTTASGLQYEVLKSVPGGAKPTATSQVEVAYHGTLIDGTVFDSSVERGNTATFGLNEVITGWTEGLQLMSVGEKYKFYVPADLGYRAQARGKIPANAVLIFEVELKQIK